MEDRKEQIELYKLAVGEYRAEVSLGWDRQKLFLTLNPVLTAFIPLVGSRSGTATRLAFVAAALIALCGVLVVRRSHGRYRAAYGLVRQYEQRLGIEGLQTTGGMREAKGLLRLERYRIVDVLVVIFVMIAALDLVMALTW